LQQAIDAVHETRAVRQIEPRCRPKWAGTTELLFDNPLHELNTDENPGFHVSMILIHDIVQVRTTTDSNRVSPTVIEFVAHAHAPQRGMAGFEPSSVMVRGCPCRLRALRKKALAAAISRMRLR
jgi:hypothetical protein